MDVFCGGFYVRPGRRFDAYCRGNDSRRGKAKKVNDGASLVVACGISGAGDVFFGILAKRQPFVGLVFGGAGVSIGNGAWNKQEAKSVKIVGAKKSA